MKHIRPPTLTNIKPHTNQCIEQHHTHVKHHHATQSHQDKMAAGPTKALEDNRALNPKPWTSQIQHQSLSPSNTMSFEFWVGDLWVFGFVSCELLSVSVLSLWVVSFWVVSVWGLGFELLSFWVLSFWVVSCGFLSFGLWSCEYLGFEV